MTENSLPLLLGIGGLVVSLLTGGFTLWAKKWRTPADDREDRKVGVEADERLLARFEKMLEQRDIQIEELRKELKGVAGKVEEVLGENRVLIDWIYAAVRIVRELDGIHLLPRPPKGVVIVDHPSNFTTQGGAPA